MKRITTEMQYEKALALIEELMDTPEKRRDNAELERLSALVMAYEAVHYPIAPPPVAAALAFRMEQEGLSQAAVSRITGIPKSRISEILSGDREPSKEHIKALHSKLGIPLHHLLGEDDNCHDVEMDFVTKTGYPDLSADLETDFDFGSLWGENDVTEVGKQIMDSALALAA